MAEYVIIDAHVHTYQSRDVGLQAKQGSSITDYAGTLDELLPIMETAGISKVVMVNMLPLADMRDAALTRLPEGLSQADREEAIKEIDGRMLGRLRRRNSWTCSLGEENPSLIPFITVDPLMDESTMITEIVDKVNRQGAKGIKLHPASQRFFPGDGRLWPAYETAQELRLPIIFHSGTFAGGTQYAEPKNFVEVLDSFPSLTLVLAHLGMGFVSEAISLSKTYPNVQFDCSGIISTGERGISDADFVGVIREIRVERVMFGSDFPWFDPGTAIERLISLDFSEQERRLILAENAMRIYRLA